LEPSKLKYQAEKYSFLAPNQFIPDLFETGYQITGSPISLSVNVYKNPLHIKIEIY